MLGAPAAQCCALLVGGRHAGMAQLLCDDQYQNVRRNLKWRPGDTIDIEIAFEGQTTARVYRVEGANGLLQTRGRRSCGHLHTFSCVGSAPSGVDHVLCNMHRRA